MLSFGKITSYPKEVIVIKITSLAWLVSKCISWKLWLSDRLFPLLPPFEFSPVLPHFVSAFLFATSLLGLCALLFFRPNKIIILGVILLEISSCLLDQMRWQPWEYQYLLTFVLFLLYKSNTKQFLDLIGFILIATYIFSGLHKFNGGFLYTVWDNFILKHILHLSNTLIAQKGLHYMGLMLSIIELILGLGLLFLKNRKTVAIFIIIMHLMLLSILGPLGANHNEVVWPWNMAMIGLVWFLFYEENSSPVTFFFFKNKLNFSMLVLVGVLPFFNFIGYWDNYLSFNLYSGDVKEVIICVKNLDKYPELKAFVLKNNPHQYCKDYDALSPNKWSFSELKVPMYAQTRTFYKLKKEWNRKYPNTDPTFIIYAYPYNEEDAIKIP